MGIMLILGYVEVMFLKFIRNNKDKHSNTLNLFGLHHKL